MFVDTYQKRIRYGETDQMGYLYYGNYPQLYEIGRVEALRSLGIRYKDCEEVYKVMLPVLELNARYLRPALYDDLVTIETRILEMPTKMIVFNHRIFNEAGDLLNKGEVKLFFVDMVENKRVSCPSFISDKIKLHFWKNTLEN